jgi:tight adherence protein B
MVKATGATVLSQLEPILIAFFCCAAVALLFFAYGDHAFGITEPYTKTAKDKLERAGMNVSAEAIGFSILCGSLGVWAIFLVLVHPTLLVSIVVLPLLLIMMIKGVEKWVEFKISKRRGAFLNQLELVLRLMASGIRAGLGIRQALVLVTEEMPDPARYEFHLLLMQTNIGVSLNDALTRLAQRMPSQETDMMTRTIIMQTQTGGNLGKTLDNLSDTIKERRRIFRKVKAITAEARGSAWILGLLPVMVFGVIMLTVPAFRGPTFNTKPGQIGMLIAFTLEGFGAYVLYRLTLFKV